jgi:hypothetical protein
MRVINKKNYILTDDYDTIDLAVALFEKKLLLSLTQQHLQIFLFLPRNRDFCTIF